MRTVDLRLTLGGAVRLAQCEQCYALVPLDDADSHAASCWAIWRDSQVATVPPDEVVPRTRGKS